MKKGDKVLVKNLKKAATYGFKNAEGYYLKFSDGSDGYFQRKDFKLFPKGSKQGAKHKFKIGDIVFAPVGTQKFYGKVKKLLVIGSGNENAYEVSGFGDPVLEKYLKKSTRKTIPNK